MLKESDVVRMTTDEGFQKKAIVEKSLSESRSYLVNSNGRLYGRNQNHLLKTYESFKTSTAKNTGVEQQTKSTLEDTEQNKAVTTRYGRVVKKPIRFTDN